MKKMLFLCWLNSVGVISPSEDQITQKTSNLYHLFIPLSNLLNTKQKCRLVQMERICRRRFLIKNRTTENFVLEFIGDQLFRNR